MFETNFWKKASDSLPSPVRARYAGYFQAAERWELALGAAKKTRPRGKQSSK